jgi:hypothetical protein
MYVPYGFPCVKNVPHKGQMSEKVDLFLVQLKALARISKSKLN